MIKFKNRIQIEREHTEMQMQMLARGLVYRRLRSRGGLFGPWGLGDLRRFDSPSGRFFGCRRLTLAFLKLEADFIFFQLEECRKWSAFFRNEAVDEVGLAVGDELLDLLSGDFFLAKGLPHTELTRARI